VVIVVVKRREIGGEHTHTREQVERLKVARERERERAREIRVEKSIYFAGGCGRSRSSRARVVLLLRSGEEESEEEERREALRPRRGNERKDYLLSRASYALLDP